MRRRSASAAVRWAVAARSVISACRSRAAVTSSRAGSGPPPPPPRRVAAPRLFDLQRRLEAGQFVAGGPSFGVRRTNGSEGLLVGRGVADDLRVARRER